MPWRPECPWYRAAPGAESCSYHTQVVDEQGGVIPKARVTLITPDGKKRGINTNPNGEATIPNLVPGVYTLTVEFGLSDSRREQSNPSARWAPRESYS